MGNSGSSLASQQAPIASKPTVPDACPVDHNTREKWLEAARKTPSSTPESTPRSPVSTSSTSKNAEEEYSRQAKHAPTRLKPQPTTSSTPPLSTSRVTSTIPRADESPATTTPSPRSLPAPAPAPGPSPEGTTPLAQTPHNNNKNWIYPSEKMFFDAMRRKNHAPSAADMPAIVPIHNAVNERAWFQILAWETASPRLKRLNAPCGGPKLRSFSGDAGKLSPKARMMGWMGYQEPFDRHDWVVERCGGGGAEGGRGGEVEYVIDFYKGRGDGLAFYLDVRPKLNSWEGWRMRVGRLVGLT